MEILNILKQALKACADVIRWGAGIQESTRKELIADLQTICANLEAAYDAVLTRLVTIKNAYNDPASLSKELRAFAGDSITRSQFKPQHLCGQVDGLMARLSSNLDPLKYSVDFRHIQELRQSLNLFGSADVAIFRSYDQFVYELDQIATQMQDQAFDPQERSRYVRHVIDGFEAELRSAQADMREAKAKAVAAM